jgi:hypothetical protein
MFKAILHSTLLCSALLSPAVMAAASNPVHFDPPLVFEPNLGQAPAQVSWTARASGYQLFLTAICGGSLFFLPWQATGWGPGQGQCGRNEVRRRSHVGCC